MSEREKVTVDDIIGIVKCEQTDSVEEVHKLRGRENRTEKRFTIKEIDNFNYGIKVTDVIMDNGIELPQSTVCDLLNELADKNEQLWNKKERYKRLSEIRQQEINNRILTIKEFMDNCSDNKVRSALKELFYSEVNEYDLSSENRELLDENEQLKSFKQRVFDLIDKTIEEETQIAENIEEVTHETRPYAKAVNRITIKILENLKWELQE